MIETNLGVSLLDREVKGKEEEGSGVAGKTIMSKEEERVYKEEEREDILVYDCSEELETGEDLSFGDRSLDDGRYLGDPDVLGCYIVRSRYSGNVDIYPSANTPRQVV